MPATAEITEAQQFQETEQLLLILIRGTMGKLLQLPRDFLPEVIPQQLPMEMDAFKLLLLQFLTAESQQTFPVQQLFAAEQTQRSPHREEQIILGTQARQPIR